MQQSFCTVFVYFIFFCSRERNGIPVFLEFFYFQTVPANAFSNYHFPVRSLTFRGNPIQFIDPNAFSGTNVQNYLTYLYISNSNLSTVPILAMQKLNTLQRLFLRYSQIRHLPPDGFNSNAFQHLNYLRIARNPLATIASFAFRGLTNLTTLDLSYNALTLIPQNAFSGLSKIRAISLYRNNILVIQSGAFLNLPLLGVRASFGESTTCSHVWCSTRAESVI